MGITTTTNNAMGDPPIISSFGSSYVAPSTSFTAPSTGPLVDPTRWYPPPVPNLTTFKANPWMGSLPPGSTDHLKSLSVKIINNIIRSIGTTSATSSHEVYTVGDIAFTITVDIPYPSFTAEEMSIIRLGGTGNDDFYKTIFKNNLPKLSRCLDYAGYTISEPLAAIRFHFKPRALPEFEDFTSWDCLFLNAASEWFRQTHQIAADVFLKSGTFKIVPDHVFIAGGALSNFYHAVSGHMLDINADVDFWFNNEISQDIFSNNYGMSSIMSSYTMDGKRVFSTFKNDSIRECVCNLPFQFIIGEALPPKKRIERFDFLHCCVYYDPAKDSLMVSSDQLASIKARQLVHNTDQVRIERVQKYLSVGWKN
jgi:hypothetical protein